MGKEFAEEDIMTFGKRLRQLRLAHHMSQKELGAMVNVTAQAVSKREMISRNPSSGQ